MGILPYTTSELGEIFNQYVRIGDPCVTNVPSLMLLILHVSVYFFSFSKFGAYFNAVRKRLYFSAFILNYGTYLSLHFNYFCNNN